MQDTKVIAYYLPQFHEVKENNEWWGDGFTEWTNVKRAKSLFEGHDQPRIPLDNNYYSLMNKDTVKWQTELADQYNVYGFAYYHYWNEGRLLLEKPAENLLKWKDINQRFFFFWANHSWCRSTEGVRTALMEQTYGNEEDWINHFKYMLPFFMDDRYIKLNNKPVMGIYMPLDIPNIDEMISLWNKLAKKNGFDGIYIIESKNTSEQKLVCKYTQAQVVRQPNIATWTYERKFYRRVIRKLKKMFQYKLSSPGTFDYEAIMKLEESYRISDGSIKEYLGINTGWDNTSRHGIWGTVMVNQTPETFGRAFRKLYNYSLELGAEFIFINAWNEWAEGMYLEPDQKDKFGYLEQIRDVASGN